VPALAARDSLGGNAVLVIGLALPASFVVAWIAGRVLGVRRSLGLAIASAALGWVGDPRSRC